MNRVPPALIIFTVLCSGLMAVVYLVSRLMNNENIGEKPAEVAAMPLAQPSMTIISTVTVTPSPIPTIDYSSVWPAETAAAAAEKLANAQGQIARAESTKASAAETQVEATKQGYVNALMPGTLTAIARATNQAEGTQVARSTIEAGNRAAYFAGVAATLTATAEAKKRNEKREDALYFAVLVAGLIVLGGVVIWIVDKKRLSDVRKAISVTAENPLDNLAPVSDGFIPISENTYHPANVPVSDAKFRAWASAMLQGETAGINKWETADSPFGRAGYAPFLEWAETRGYIELCGGAKMLSDRGRVFCQAWLQRRGTPPPNDFAPGNAKTVMNHAIPYPQNSGGGGEEDRK